MYFINRWQSRVRPPKKGIWWNSFLLKIILNPKTKKAITMMNTAKDRMTNQIHLNF